MKFGKRLASEASRRWRPFYLDYKTVKRAIQHDVRARDPSGPQFAAAIQQELERINAFYSEQEQQLETFNTAARLHLLSSEVIDLRKFVVLNYIAVIKAYKKRNRHLQAACKDSTAVAVDAVDLLSQQYFFTSTKLASLATEAEIMTKEMGQAEEPAEVLQDYQCAICLGVLHNPVVLTCAHRFCWGCLVTHCSTVLSNRHAHGVAHGHGDDDSKGSKPGSSQPAHVVAAEMHCGHGVSTYNCPICRKAQILDLDRLQVDAHLSNFIADLKLRQVDPLAITSTTTPTHASVQQHSRLAALMLPLTVPESQSEQASTGPQSLQAAVSTPEPLPSASADSQLAETTVAAVSTDALSSATVEVGPQHATAQQLSCLGRRPTETLSEQAVAVPIAAAAAHQEPPLLPPQRPEHKGKLTVVLDLDGTLISSFTPRRAPRLPPGSTSYIVGKGGRLNPQGVFVVERPGLQEFFAQLSTFAEIVLFTAGLEDYARPIVDALDHNYRFCFQGRRLYRPATVSCDLYPCIKDLSRLGRDLKRTVLIDDTPLAFLNQPDNGIPIYGFRGDVDDRMLTEAMLPLLESLADAQDVRPALHKRFGMPQWFRAQGVPVKLIRHTAKPEVTVKRKLQLTKAQSGPDRISSRHQADQTPASLQPARLLLCDFDKTIADFDAGERLVEELAPELTPMLASLEMPANFVPVTNAVLAEMARRGIGRQQILTALRKMGTELPQDSVKMMQWAHQQGIDMRILSDCNSVFISHMLTGAKVNTRVQEVVTNFSSFVRCQPSTNLQHGSAQSESQADSAHSDAESSTASPGRLQSASSGSESAGGATWSDAAAGKAAASHRMVVQPRHDWTVSSHGCPLCPANLCKGQELEALRTATPYQHIVYCGDGANDLCPALALAPGDVVLARKGHALEKLIAARAHSPDETERVVAQVHIWNDHAHLLQLVKDAMQM
ncbi:MAG: CTD small phosphatase 2-like [Trebouxia sp. A1-2]|nr:MAG: CTD small phosphatase 2-like [Trebouxia sp. A1-2]